MVVGLAVTESAQFCCPIAAADVWYNVGVDGKQIIKEPGKLRRFHFSPRDLLVCIALVSVGLGAWFLTESSRELNNCLLGGVAYYASAAVVGAGIGTLFHRKLAGAFLSCAAVTLVGVVRIIIGILTFKDPM